MNLLLNFNHLKGSLRVCGQIASIAALVVSYFVAVQFNEPVAGYIQLEAPLNKLAAMGILYVGTTLGIWIGFGFVRRYMEKMSLKEFDRHAGALLGAVTGVLLCVSLTFFLVTMLNDNHRQYITRSKSGMYITQGINQYQSAFPPAVHEALAPYIQRLNEEMQRQQDATESGLLADPDNTLFQQSSPDGSGSSNWIMPTNPSRYPNQQPSSNGYPQAPPTDSYNGYNPGTSNPSGYGNLGGYSG